MSKEEYKGDAFPTTGIRKALDNVNAEERAAAAMEQAAAEMAAPIKASAFGGPTGPKEAKRPFVVEQLVEKAKLFQERHAVYGDNYLRFGPIMSLLMDANTLDPRNVHDMARFGLLVQLVSKMTRYAENFNRGGHDDSLDDIAVYAMMLKQVDSKS